MGDMNGLAFNPNGMMLGSTSGDSDARVRDNSVRFWNIDKAKN
jgi:hypothetical protein